MRNQWVMVSVLALCACSGKKSADDKPAAGTAGSAVATAPAAAAPTAAAPAPAAPAAAKGCDILKKDEAAHLVGAEVEDGIESDEEGLGCLYNAKVGNNSANVIIYSGDGAAKYDELKKTEDEPVDLPGIGDHAYRTKSGTQLVVVAHGRCALIAINTLGSKTKPAPDAGVDVAKAVAGRL